MNQSTDTDPVSTILLADDFTLPLDSATATMAILGKKGRGKTHTAAVFAEGLINAGIQTTVLDPTGAWYGLRSSSDGASPGLPVVIFGGEHADIPIAAELGEQIATILVDRRFPAVLDISGLRKNQRRHFATQFLETLYQQNRTAHHIIIDEADEVAPQRAFAGVERLLGATEDIVRRGRIHGLGVTMISQRPASVNKTVLSQVDALILLGMTGPHDIGAVADWVSLHSDPDQARLLTSSLPSLPVGEAWVWSPEWLATTRRVHIRRRTTFDSSSTPKADGQRIVPTKWAHVDVAEINSQLAVPTTDHGAGLDPDGLRARIATLESQLAAERRRPPIHVPALTDGDHTRLTEIVNALTELSIEIATTASTLASTLATSPGQPSTHTTLPAPSNSSASESPQQLGKAEREILTVLAQHGERTTTQVALLTGRSHKSGGFRNSLSKLRTAELIAGRGTVQITPTGAGALGRWEPLPQPGPELVQWWGTHLGKAERLVLEYLAQHPNREVPITEIAEHTGYSATAGGFRNSLSRLRTLGLAHGRGALQISSQLGTDPST